MVRVLQISDTHLGAEPNTPTDKIPNPDAALVQTIDAASGSQPDLVLLSGDLADDGSIAALQRLNDLVAAFAAPMLAVAGNHDLIDSVRSVFGALDVMEIGAWRMLGVETVIPGEIHGAVDVDDMTRRLDEVDDRPTVLALHHPPRSTSTHPWFQLTGAEQMLAELRRRPHVRAVVSGHLHEAFRLREGDLELCGAPSTYYAIEHSGDSYRTPRDGLVGAQMLTLGDDGSFSCEPIDRSLGC
ncbi:MAG: 3,5-cyclic-AMP phosphodiesterase [Ilumatobacteraceae bacterium]|nr:3,5-cyclic-AMP phosphodiesterase [Ilumatobacteraceae bacterium]